MEQKQMLQQVGAFVSNHKIAVGGSALAITLFLLILSFQRARNKILRRARKWLGVTEIGNNQGWNNSDFQKKMQAVGWSKGQEWCAFFVKMVVLDCCKKDSAAYIFWNSHLSGGTQWNWATLSKQNSDYHKVISKPEKGCIVIYQNKSDSSKGHTEFVEKVNSDGSFQSISGNSPFDDKNGQGVARKSRSSIGYGSARILGFIKILKL